jgi:polyhydroxyalkanoate synthesis regulator phasin
MASTLEKGLDFTFGAAILTAEALNQAIAGLVERGKLAQEHAPAVFEAIMEKGRPAREGLFRNLRDEMLHPRKGVAALDEIQALEERVAVLERQIAPPSAAQATDDGDKAAEAGDTTGSGVAGSDAAVTGADTATDIEVAAGEAPIAAPSGEQQRGGADAAA